MTWIIGLTDDIDERKKDLSNPPDWQQTQFETEAAAKDWKSKYLDKQGYVEDRASSGWRFGYWYSTKLIPCPDCSKMISPNAVTCPDCGNPMGGQSHAGDDSGKTKCPNCGKMVQPVVTSVGGGSCSVGSREKWTCPACRHVIRRTGCFVATATYGNDDEIEVRFLRAYRDRYLQTNVLGKCFIWLYYNIAPYPAWVVLRVSVLRRICRSVLDWIVTAIEKNTPLRRSDFK